METHLSFGSLDYFDIAAKAKFDEFDASLI